MEGTQGIAWSICLRQREVPLLVLQRTFSVAPQRSASPQTPRARAPCALPPASANPPKMNLRERFLFGHLPLLGSRMQPPKLLHRPIHDRAQCSLPHPFDKRVDRRDPTNVNVLFAFFLDDFEFRVIDKNPVPILLGPAVHNQFLANRQHSLHIMLIEPATGHASA